MSTLAYTEEELERAARRFEELADQLDPETARFESTDGLRAIAEIADATRVYEARPREAVQIARARGRSWTRVAIALDVPPQAARERFGAKHDT